MQKKFEITREIGIDAAHRVPHHASKCFNIHGHRYVIQATCRGELQAEGEQTGMVLDFGFLKEEMMRWIDAEADHAFLVWRYDPLVQILADCQYTKLVLLDFVPTAENLAAYWYGLLSDPIKARSEGNAELVRLRVFETPNCWADYPNEV